MFATVSAALLSPIKFELPSTPELRAMSTKFIAIHDRLRRQLKSKKILAEGRRALSGLDVPIPESPGAGSAEHYFGLDVSAAARSKDRRS